MTQSRTTRVIVTRPEADGLRFAANLAAAGMTAILSPVMVIRERLTAEDVESVGAAIFTSANGLRALASATAKRDMTVFAVGAATAGEARALGFCEVHEAGGDVASLAALIARRYAGSKPAGELVHFGGEALAGDIVGDLSASGITARRVIAYSAELAPALSEGAAAALAAPSKTLWVSHFSPRSARLFLGLADVAGLSGQIGQVGAACLSAAVAKAAEPRRWRDIVIAAAPDAHALIKAILGAR